MKRCYNFFIPDLKHRRGMNKQPYYNKFQNQSDIEVVFCPYCGTQNPAYSKFCYACGQAIPQRKPPTAWFRRTGVLLGGLGAAAVAALVVIFLALKPLLAPGPQPVLFPEPETQAEPVQRSPTEEEQTQSGGQAESSGGQPEEVPKPADGGPAVQEDSQPTKADEPSGSSELRGKIVYNCVIEGFQQVCMMNADGSKPDQLTHYAAAASTYPSLTPDGESVLYTSNESGDHAIYLMRLSSRDAARLTEPGGDKAYPEMSPDGKKIAYSDVKDKKDVIYVMNRDGSGLSEVYRGGLHPAWSPDGKQIAFLCVEKTRQKICIMNADGSGARTVTNMDGIGAQVVWSPEGQELAFFAGAKGARRLCAIRPDGSGYRVIREGFDSVSPSYSPDGRWLVFTEYRPEGEEKPGEIYIIRTDGSDARRLTNNARTDWLPFWGK